MQPPANAPRNLALGAASNDVTEAALLATVSPSSTVPHPPSPCPSPRSRSRPAYFFLPAPFLLGLFLFSILSSLSGSSANLFFLPLAPLRPLSITPQFTMASVTRLSNAALRASLRSSSVNGSAFNAVRCYSAKTQVRTGASGRVQFLGYGTVSLTPVADPQGAIRRAAARED